MSARVLLIRHAETAEPGIFHGAESDVGLSERGLRQAEAVAEALSDWQPSKLVSSGMLRARLTAAPISRKFDLPIQVEPQLHERGVGDLAGKPTGNCDGVWPATLDRWLAGETGYAPPGAESYDDIQRRVLPVWHRLTEEAEGQTLVIVAHGVVCRVLLLTLLSGFTVKSWHQIPIRNVSISELVGQKDRWEAARLAEVPARVLQVG